VDQDLIEQTAYDAAGRRVQTTGAAGRVTQFGYDGQDRLVRVTENVLSVSACSAARTDCNVVTQYRYDRAGNRVAIIDPRGNARRFSYNAADWQTAVTDALNQTTSWEYDQHGRVLAHAGAATTCSITTTGWIGAPARRRVMSPTWRPSAPATTRWAGARA
jgi:YD repeat-containing protein